MKRILCSLLILPLLLCLCACSDEIDENSARFYYVRESYIYGQEDGVMAAEIRDIQEFANEQDIMRAYLNGPLDIGLASPFPSETEIVGFSYKGDTLYVTLSAHIVTLSKANQVLACACFARTAIELTGAQAVYFQTDSDGLAQMEPIRITKDAVMLYDDYNSPTPTGP